MATIVRTKEIPVAGEFDVVVCGGGPSGIISAIAAARSGARTALIERYGFLGGMATASTVAPISEFMHHGHMVVGGIPWEFASRIAQRGDGELCAPKGNFVFKPETYKLIAQRMLLEAGVKLFLHSYITDCVLSDNRISHLVFDSKSGTQALGAKYVIDATGDGDIANMAGVPMQEYLMERQPATLCFTLGGVKTDEIPTYYPGGNYQNVGSRLQDIQDFLNQLREHEDVPQFGGPWCCAGLGDGYGLINMTRKGVDMTDVQEATAAECTLREDVFRLVELLKEHFEPFKDCYLVSIAAQVGTRETRHIKGVHVLTGEEYRQAQFFPDSIARCAHPIDIHSAEDNSQIVTYLEKAAYLPYRSIITEEVDNLLVPSRCFSADQVAFASARVQAGVMGLGQAAGAAAAQCNEDSRPVRDVDIERLRSTLTGWGAYIGEDDI